jgi:hypothetical protein
MWLGVLSFYLSCLVCVVLFLLMDLCLLFWKIVKYFLFYIVIFSSSVTLIRCMSDLIFCYMCLACLIFHLFVCVNSEYFSFQLSFNSLILPSAVSNLLFHLLIVFHPNSYIFNFWKFCLVDFSHLFASLLLSSLFKFHLLWLSILSDNR